MEDWQLPEVRVRPHLPLRHTTETRSEVKSGIISGQWVKLSSGNIIAHLKQAITRIVIKNYASLHNIIFNVCFLVCRYDEAHHH